PDNVDGREATAANIAGTLVDWGATREVKPGFGLYNDATATNNGFYVVAPKWTYPANGTAADPFGVALTPSLSSDQMTYSLLQANDPTIAPAAGGTDYRPAILLQRLANPYLPLQNTDPTKATYNPYITVDYVEQVRVNDYRLYDAAGTDLMPAGKYNAAN